MKKAPIITSRKTPRLPNLKIVKKKVHPVAVQTLNRLDVPGQKRRSGARSPKVAVTTRGSLTHLTPRIVAKEKKMGSHATHVILPVTSPLPILPTPIPDEEKKDTKYSTHLNSMCNKEKPQLKVAIQKNTIELFTNVFIAGGGPASLGLLANVERSGKLRDILEGVGMNDVEDTDKHTIIVAEKSNQHGLGRGQLGKYLCPSNTSAGCFVKNITRADDIAKAPPSYLSELEHSHSAKMLLKCGSGPADLTQVGQFLHKVACQLTTRFDNALSKGKLLVNTCVNQIVVKNNNTYKITCLQHSFATEPQKIIIHANKILLAVGGIPYLPESVKTYVDTLEQTNKKSRRVVPPNKKGSNNHKNKKMEKPTLLIAAEEVLKKDGLYKVFHRLKPLCYPGSSNNKKDPSVAPQIVIIGGSHSALAVANLLLQASRKDHRLINILNCHRNNLSSNSGNSATPNVNMYCKNDYEIFDEKLKNYKCTNDSNASDNDKIDSNNKEEEKEKKYEGSKSSNSCRSMPIYKFKADDILCLHRSPIRLFFHSLENAKNAGYKIEETALSRKNKRVHPHTGLRGPARSLVIKVKKGREHCVKFQLCKNESELWKRMDKAKPKVIIYSTGYSTNAKKIKFLMENKNLDDSDETTEVEFCETKSGGILVGESGEILHTVRNKNIDDTTSESKEILKNCFSLGLGTVYGADHVAIGGESDANEKGADGVNLYIGALGKHVRNGIWPEYYQQEIQEEEKEQKANAVKSEKEQKRKEEEPLHEVEDEEKKKSDKVDADEM
eukprot:g7296.t1